MLLKGMKLEATPPSRVGLKTLGYMDPYLPLRDRTEPSRV